MVRFLAGCYVGMGAVLIWMGARAGRPQANAHPFIRFGGRGWYAL